MGEHSVTVAKTHEEAGLFMDVLLKDLEALDYMIKHGLIESDVQRIGAEQEIHLVNSSYRPAPIIMEFLKRLDDEHFTTEHASFNSEINVEPLPFTNDCLSRIESQLKELLNKAREVLKELDSDLIYTGILPTISRHDLRDENLTPVPRYSLLASLYDAIRGEPFSIRIEGTDQLITRVDSTIFEGSNTSFQIHLQVNAETFSKVYNWAQLISGPILSACTNSPLFLGRRLWRETRIALFEQAIDTRKITKNITDKTPRVFFGKKWLEDGPLEIFREDIARHRVILHGPIHEDALEELKEGRIPKLAALKIHNGTVYRWNRPCYGITSGKPHLRIENRYLPAGPSLVDQTANAALWLGLMNGMSPEYYNIPSLIDFDKAKSNFIKAAKLGLGAQFTWVNGKKVTASQLLIKELLPIAEYGLKKAAVEPKDIQKYLNIVRRRISTGITGSQWILNSFNELQKKHDQGETLVAITGATIKNQRDNLPVHKWPIPSISDAGSWKNRYWLIGQFMSTDLFTVHENDIVRLAADIMRWKHIRHVPVEDDHGNLVGLLTSGMLLKYFGFRSKVVFEPVPVKELMIKNPITVPPEYTVLEAIDLLLKNKIGCLPVVSHGQLIGIVTEHDFVRGSKILFNECEA